MIISGAAMAHSREVIVLLMTPQPELSENTSPESEVRVYNERTLRTTVLILYCILAVVVLVQCDAEDSLQTGGPGDQPPLVVPLSKLVPPSI